MTNFRTEIETKIDFFLNTNLAQTLPVRQFADNKVLICSLKTITIIFKLRLSCRRTDKKVFHFNNKIK